MTATDSQPPPSRCFFKIPATFRALTFPNYRYMWLGQLGHSAAIWMEQVVRPLLMLELTGAPIQVGLVVAVRMAPQLLFGLLAGAAADRYDKRRILLATQWITLSMHLVLAVLILAGKLAIWHVFVTAFVAGASMAFNQPARQSMIPRLVPADALLNAIALNTMAINIMRVLGASLAGILLVFLDYGQVYLMNAIIFIYVIWATARITLKETPRTNRLAPAGMAPNLLHDLLAGFRYMLANPTVLHLVGLALVIFVIGQPYQQVFVPLLALDVLKIGRSGAGGLLACVGVGALIGSLAIASLQKLPRRGLILMAAIVAYGMALLLLAYSRSVWLSSAALIAAGILTTAYNSLNVSLLVEKSAADYHGRVLSLLSLDRGLVSVGAVIAGVLAQFFGPRIGLGIVALACIAMTLLIYYLAPPLRKIK